MITKNYIKMCEQAEEIRKLKPLVEFTRTKAFYRSRPFESLNELWLAFVMKEKYHKIWTGEEWINKGGVSNQ